MVITKSDFLKGKLFTSFNDYSAEELFEGTIDKIPVKFTEVHLQSKSRYRSYTVFRGFYSNFNTITIRQANPGKKIK